MYMLQQKYIFWVYNNAETGHTIGDVNATDADTGQFGLIQYSIISDPDNYFSIDPTTVCELEFMTRWQIYGWARGGKTMVFK